MFRGIRVCGLGKSLGLWRLRFGISLRGIITLFANENTVRTSNFHARIKDCYLTGHACEKPALYLNPKALARYEA